MKIGDSKNQDLGEAQKRILELYLQGEKQARIAKRLKISRQRVSFVLKKLTKKGYITRVEQGGLTNGGGITLVNPLPPSNKWRYHALQFELKPYYFMPRYHRIRQEVGNHSIPYGVWRIILYEKKIIIWLQGGHSFEHTNRDKAVMLACTDFNKVLDQLSARYGFKVFKDQRASIRLLKHELAYQNPPEFKIITKDQVYIQFRGYDGKVWLQYDRSKGIREREYVHFNAVDHADTLEPYLNDLMHNAPLTNSQLTSRLNDVITALERITKVLDGDL